MQRNVAEIPTYVLRYEDLILRPEETMLEIFAFLLDVPSVEGTIVEHQIKRVVNSGISGKTVYGLKPGAGKLNRQLDKYTEKNIEDIKRICRRGLHYWGYTEHPDDPENPTAFYKDFEGGQSEEELKDLYMKYRRHNEQTLAQLGQNKDDIKQFTYMDGELARAWSPILPPAHVADKLYIKE